MTMPEWLDNTINQDRADAEVDIDLRHRIQRIELQRAWVNCPKREYLRRIALVSRWKRQRFGDEIVTPELHRELSMLSNPDLGVVPHRALRYAGHGRLINPVTWLMALRASRRGQLAMPWLHGDDRSFAAATCKKRGRYATSFGYALRLILLWQQAAFLEHLMLHCPLVFDGMLVLNEDGGE